MAYRWKQNKIIVLSMLTLSLYLLKKLSTKKNIL